MAVKKSDVKVGGVYATANNQERRVVAIAHGRVTYESRGENVGNDWSPGHTKTNPPLIDTFAGACDSVVSLPNSYPEVWQAEEDVSSMRYQPAICDDLYVLRIFRITSHPEKRWCHEIAGPGGIFGMDKHGSMEEARDAAIRSADSCAEQLANRA